MSSRQDPGVALLELAALGAVARAGTIAAAALVLGTSAHDVQARISRLEDATGHRLLARDGDGGAEPLTSAGRLLAEHAQAIGDTVSAARRELAALAGARADHLRIGATRELPARLLADLVAALAETLPERPAVTVTTGDRAAALDALAAGHLHALADAGEPPDDPRVEVAMLLHDPWALLVGSSSPLAERAAPLSAADLAALPLVQAFGIDDAATAQALVAAGVGSAILPRTAIDACRPGVVAIDIGHLLPARPILLLWAAGTGATAPVAAARAAAAAVATRIATRRDALAALQDGTG
ncbi:LysR substrate-binding domain-containing protein [Conexibacter woesei]|uniref:LysR substrate-binding domain-containing protein n=1 Tax=Conexibacter woesei TaxID=191495 RepID=UPI000687D31D|nr:LysR substrate-binding domain-containing protein [Conexibacter woesei]